MEYVYAALLLHKLGKPVDEAGIKKIIHSIGLEANESKVKNLVASLSDVDIDKELENAVFSVGPVGGQVSDSKEAKTEAAPKEEKKEAAAEGLSALFG